MTEELCLDDRKSYLNGNGNSIMSTWRGVKNATNLNKFSHATYCLTRDDLESVGMFGVMKAFETFNFEKGMKLRTWVINVCNQHIIREVRKYYTPSQPISSVEFDEFNPIELLISKISTDYEPSFIDEDLYNYIIKKIKKKLYNRNRAIYNLLIFKLNNLHLDDSATYHQFGISPTSYYNYLKIISDIVREIIKSL